MNMFKASNARKPKKGYSIKLLDAAILLIIVLSALSVWLFIPKYGSIVTVFWHGERLYSGSIDSDIELTTPDGQNIISVRNGRAFMLNAECADKTCVHMGNASPAKPVVCLPNRVIITVTGETEVDSTTW